MSYAKVKLALEKHIHSLEMGVVVYDDSRHRRSHKNHFIVVEFHPGKTKRVFVGAGEPQERNGSLDFVVKETTPQSELENLDVLLDQFPSGLILTEEGIRTSVVGGEIIRQKPSKSNFNYRLKISWRSFF